MDSLLKPIDDLPDARVTAAVSLSRRLRHAKTVGVHGPAARQAAADLAAAGVVVVTHGLGNLLPVPTVTVRRAHTRRFTKQG